jgi:hypothetical protein
LKYVTEAKKVTLRKSNRYQRWLLIKKGRSYHQTDLSHHFFSYFSSKLKRILEGLLFFIGKMRFNSHSSVFFQFYPSHPFSTIFSSFLNCLGSSKSFIMNKTVWKQFKNCIEQIDNFFDRNENEQISF